MITVGTILGYVGTHMQENGAAFNVTGLWSVDSMIEWTSLSDREFLVRSGLYKKLTPVVSVADQVVYNEPSGSIDVERVSWNAAKLYPETRFELDAQNPEWRSDTGRNPRRYHRDGLPSKKFGVWPAPNVDGTEWILTGRTTGIPSTISGSYTYSVTGTTGIISAIGGDKDYLIGYEIHPNTIPGCGTWGQIASETRNFLCWHDLLPPAPTALTDFIFTPDAFSRYVMYGVLAQAWDNEGDGQDLVRAKYCRARFDRGVWLAKRAVYGDIPALAEGAS